MQNRFVRRRHLSSTRPLIVFGLVVVLGALSTGCTSTEINPLDHVTQEAQLTEGDLEEIAQLEAQHPPHQPTEIVLTTGSTGTTLKQSTVDPSILSFQKGIRSSSTTGGDNMYRVTNAFVNLRSAPTMRSQTVGRLEQGELLTVLEHVNAAWAKVKADDGSEAFVSSRFIAQPVSDAQLVVEKKKYEGQYFVDFAFLNVRREPDRTSEKIGELPGQTIVRPLNIDNGWARIITNDREGYVASDEYLRPFLPNFIVRQEEFSLPIFSYRYLNSDLIDRIFLHAEALQKANVNLITLREFARLLEQQEREDVRLPPRSAVIAIYDADAEEMQRIVDVFRPSSIRLTFFVQTQYLGIDGITEAFVKRLLADGFDIQSGGHMNDDLRSLTSTQIDIELLQSKEMLESIIGEVIAIGYPRGSSNDRVNEQAANAGYLLGVASGDQKTFDRAQLLNIPSYFVSSGMRSEDLVEIVTGGGA